MTMAVSKEHFPLGLSKTDIRGSVDVWPPGIQTDSLPEENFSVLTCH